MGHQVRSARWRFALAVITASLLLQAGCEGLQRAVADGVFDFVESTTANLLEQAFPVMPEGGGGGGM